MGGDAWNEGAEPGSVTVPFVHWSFSDLVLLRRSVLMSKRFVFMYIMLSHCEAAFVIHLLPFFLFSIYFRLLCIVYRMDLELMFLSKDMYRQGVCPV